MAYQALYRVWRPQRFADLVGQDLISQTLKNAITTNQISHAYLFCGPRGTGKTSTAKIFAKAINCPHQQDGEPCNECDLCQEITQGRLNDVIEIDAASNNGVDEIREIRDKVKYAPTQATYKVYIIDEVHMLSQGAFNALLKTLEEPPANVVFILATTEPHKILPTIISRTQRFDFKRIRPQEILKRLEFILEQKQIKYDLAALKLVAKAAEGGMRDALSILDQVISYSVDNQVTTQNALLVTGSVTKEHLTQYLNYVSAQQTNEALALVHEILAEGKEPKRFIEELIEYCRDLLLYNQAPEMVEENQLGMVDEAFKTLAQQISAKNLYQMIETMTTQQEALRYSEHAEVYLEILTVKLVDLPTTQIASSPSKENKSDDVSQIAQLAQQVEQLKQELAQLKNATSQTTRVPVMKAKANIAAKVDKDKIYQILAQADRNSLVQIKRIWNNTIRELAPKMSSKLLNTMPVASGNLGTVVSVEIDFLCKELQDDVALTAKLKEVLALDATQEICFVTKQDWQNLREDYLKNYHVKQSSKAQPKEDLNVKKEINNLSQQQNAPVNDILVDEALKLFGNELVEVTED